ncbi:MAG: hypothetical protein HFH68_04340 [Lachnospiraceae bacterium]|nr:hypothetical protein [Lachnospiraceae bacterium]
MGVLGKHIKPCYLLRRSLGIMLAAALAVTEIVPVYALAAEEGDGTGSITNLVVNPSFEISNNWGNGIDGWIISDNTTDYGSKDANGSGKAAHYHWITETQTGCDGGVVLEFNAGYESTNDANKYIGNVYQEINNVPDGKYELSAWIYGDKETYGKIYAYSGSQDNEKSSMFNKEGSIETNWNSWQEIKVSDIEVTGGSIIIGAEAEGGENAGKTLWLDKFSLINTGDTDTGDGDGEENPNPEPDETGKGSFINGSFEEFPDTYIPAGWETEGTPVYSMKRADARDGEYTLQTGGVETDTSIYQNVTGLVPGRKYVFTVYAQTGAPEECFIYASSDSQEQVKKDIASGWNWQANKLEFKAGTDGKAVVGIHVKSAADVWAIFDDCSLELVQEYNDTDIKPDNSSFERTDEDGSLLSWTMDSTGIIELKENGAHTGVKYLDITGTSDYKAEISQEVTGLEEGWYYLTAYANKTKGESSKDQKICYLYGNGTGQSKSITAIPRRGVKKSENEWTLITARGIYVGEDGKATVGVYTDAYAGNRLKLDTIQLQREKNQDRQYSINQGGDMSMITWLEDEGAKFYDEAGMEGDVFQILADTGYNIARLRLYNNPGKGRGENGYYCPEGYETLEDILSQAKRAKEKGMRIQLSLHFSDYWSNAATQIIPSEWQEKIKGMNEEEAVNKLEELTGEYTAEVLDAMAAQDTFPEYISFGNEMQDGLFYPLGKAANDRWPYLARFLNSAAKAVRAAEEEYGKECGIILHLDGAGDTSKYNGFFDKCEEYNVDYDIIGPSYYPFWTNMEPGQIVDFCNGLVDRYDKDIMLMETAICFNDLLANGKDTGQLYHNGPYPFMGKDANGNQADGGSSPDNQREFMYEVLNGVKSVKDGRCIGDLYWDPVMVQQENVGWAMLEESDTADVNVISNTTLFDFGHKLLPVADAYRYNREGSLAETGILDGKIISSDGKGVSGVTAKLLLTDNTKAGQAVTIKTGRYGEFRKEVPAGDYTISADIEGMDCSIDNPGSITIGKGNVSSEPAIITATGVSLNGRVIYNKETDTRESAFPVAGALVTACNTKSGDVFSIYTDVTGNWVFENIPKGSYSITVKAAGYKQEQPQVIELQATSGQDIIIQKTSGTVSGTITTSSKMPIEGARVSASDGTDTINVKTGADGFYTLDLEAGRTYKISYVKNSYATEERECSLSVYEEKELSVVLEDNTGTITGKVTDKDKAPLAGINVAIGMYGGMKTVTDETGSFKFENVTAGTVKLSISAAGGIGRDLQLEIEKDTVCDAGIIVMPEDTGKITNPSFENSSDGWKFTCQEGTNGVVVQERSAASRYDGIYALAFWSADKFWADASQTVTGLEKGTYILRAHAYTGVTHSEWMDGKFYMYVKDPQGEVIARKDIPNTGAYMPVELEFAVDKGEDITVGFYMDTVSKDWAVLDLVQLGYCGKENGIVEEPSPVPSPEITSSPKPGGSVILNPYYPAATASAQPVESPLPETSALPEASLQPEASPQPQVTVQPEASMQPQVTAKPSESAVPSVTEKPVDNNDKDKPVNVSLTVNGKVSKKEVKAVISKGSIKEIQEIKTAKPVNVKIKIKDSKGKKLCTVTVDKDNLIKGKKLYIYAYNNNTGKYTMVNAKTYKISGNGSLTLTMPAGKNYILLDKADSKKAEKKIMKTIKLSAVEKTARTGKKVKIPFNKKMDKASIKKITASSANKNIATVLKSGKIKTKSKGSVVINVKVTMKNEKTKKLNFKIIVK